MPQGTILAVDDTPANLLLLSQMLAQYGYKVRAASSGARAGICKGIVFFRFAGCERIRLASRPGIKDWNVC